jgi:hypothetical protein
MTVLSTLGAVHRRNNMAKIVQKPAPIPKIVAQGFRLKPNKPSYPIATFFNKEDADQWLEFMSEREGHYHLCFVQQERR